MSYSTFLNNTKNAFSNILNLFNLVLSSLLNNNIFKFIIHTVLFGFVIFLLISLIKLILNIFSMKKTADKQKEKSNSDIE